MRRSFLATAIALWMATSMCTPLQAETASMNLIVSAGALSEHDPFGPFLHSRVFYNEANPPFEIIDAMAEVYESDSTVFYSNEAIDRKRLISLTKGASVDNMVGFVGHSYRGFLLSGAEQRDLRAYLGAAHLKNIPMQIAGSVKAFSKSTRAIVWPKSVDELRRVPAVIVRHHESGAEYLVTARAVGDVAHRFGVLDALLKDSPHTWVDLGTNHGHIASLSDRALEAVVKRNPLVTYLGTWEMAASIVDPQTFKDFPAVFPFSDKATMQIDSHGRKVNFWSVTGKEQLWSLYDKLGTRLSVNDAIAKMKDESKNQERSINIVRAFSEEAAVDAAKSVFVDLVLLVAKDPYLQLPTKEVIDLRDARSDAYEQVAPIVRVSYLDLSEVKIYRADKKTIQRVEVNRHVVNDDMPRALDLPSANAVAQEGAIAIESLARPWEKQDYESILGGLMLKESKADIAIFGELHHATPIHGKLPFSVAKALMMPEGNLAVITTTGRQIKAIGNLIKSKELSKNLIVYGIDISSSAINGRAINDREYFKVALTEEALLDLFRASRLGGLGEVYSIRAPFIEGIYADARQLFYVGGPKVISTTDTAEELKRAVSNIKTESSFSELFDRSLPTLTLAQAAEFIDDRDGRFDHVLTFDISYLDIGISQNVVNINYKKNMGTFPTSRGTIKPYAHLFLYSKMALNYETPWLNSSLFTDVKYMHTNLDEKPEKDKTKLGLKFRLPWERSYFKDHSVVVSPLLVSIFETKLAPHPWAKGVDLMKKPRTKRIDTLLGVNVDFTKLGFNADVGGVMAADFNRVNVNDALDFGPGMNFYSRWRLVGPLELSSEITAYYLFPLPKNLAKDKIALGVEGLLSLRLARFYDFSVAAMSDFLVATLQQAPKDVILSSIFGLTVSYGRLFRIHG